MIDLLYPKLISTQEERALNNERFTVEHACGILAEILLQDIDISVSICVQMQRYQKYPSPSILLWATAIRETPSPR